MRKSEQMTCELFTSTGERKYLTEAECEAFMAAAIAHERGEVRTFGLFTSTATHRRVMYSPPP